MLIICVLQNNFKKKFYGVKNTLRKPLKSGLIGGKNRPVRHPDFIDTLSPPALLFHVRINKNFQLCDKKIAIIRTSLNSFLVIL